MKLEETKRVVDIEEYIERDGEAMREGARV